MDSKLYIGIDNLSASAIEDDAELIPLLTPEDEEEMNKEDVPEQLPILPLRNTVLFPGVVVPVTAGRDTSIALIKAANQGSKTIGVVGQRDAAVENPSIEGSRSPSSRRIRLPVYHTCLKSKHDASLIIIPWNTELGNNYRENLEYRTRE